MSEADTDEGEGSGNDMFREILDVMQRHEVDVDHPTEVFRACLSLQGAVLAFMHQNGQDPQLVPNLIDEARDALKEHVLGQAN